MRGVGPIDFDSGGDQPRRAARAAVAQLYRDGWLHAGDRVLITSGDHMEHLGATNTLRLLTVGVDGAAEGLGDLSAQNSRSTPDPRDQDDADE